MKQLGLFCLILVLCGCVEKNYWTSQDAEVVRYVPKKSLSEYKHSFFNLYSAQDDIQIGEKVMDLQIREFRKNKVGVDLPKDEKLKKRIEAIVQRIARVSDKPDFPYEVHIFDKPDVVNAFCMPGGKIGVFTGLFDKEKGLIDIKNDHEIASVIGHEMAHATLRHVTRQVTALQGWGFLGSIASVTVGNTVGADIQAVFNRVFNLGTHLYFPTYSRKFETQADQVGFYYMVRAGFKPQAAIDVWKRAANRGGPNSDQTAFFATHPASGERARFLEAWLPEAINIQRGMVQN